MASKKERLDVLLVDKGICTSRERAKTNIMAGLIFVLSMQTTLSSVLNFQANCP